MIDDSRGLLVYFSRQEVESRKGLGPISGHHKKQEECQNQSRADALEGRIREMQSCCLNDLNRKGEKLPVFLYFSY